ncbi:hypothetical protein ACFPIJ_17250 [Dactylosporangium cerinum]|uniref:Uncharacterized protein n=1 Tax=Dactylosporangium cerinum TaxID=1434730 RepID=A0ABV9VW05_9ACTN
MRASDWSNVDSASVTGGRWSPQLAVTFVDPDRLRPAPDPWQLAAAFRRGRYRIVVPLGGSRADVARLAEGLAATPQR